MKNDPKKMTMANVVYHTNKLSSNGIVPKSKKGKKATGFMGLEVKSKK